MQNQVITRSIYDPSLWKRFFKISRMYWLSERKWQAWSLLILLLAMMFAAPLLTAKSMSIVKEVTDSLEKMQLQPFYHALLLMLLVIVATILLEVFITFVKKMLNINWRLWLTTSLMGSYFENRNYYAISNDPALDNPDQRISESIGRYTDTSIDHLTTIFQSLFSFSVFSVTLWHLSPKLFGIVLLYVGIFTLVTMWLSKHLVRLNYQVQQRKAEFRHGLVHVRDHTESIAFFRGERLEKQQLVQQLGSYISCNLKLIGWERNLSCITETANYIPMLLPGLVLAPGYFAGTITLGDMLLGSAAFMAVLNSLNKIVGKLSSLNVLAASFTRVDDLAAALESSSNRATSPVIATREESSIGLIHLTLQTPDHRRTLLHDATALLSPGKGLLIAGASGTGKSSLLRALAGLWNAGTGEITRPPLREMLFLPQRPYMIQGTLREQLLYPNLEQAASDAKLQEVLQKVNLANLAERFNGFDTEKDWATILSLGEQQRIAFARLLLVNPRYAILDEASSALDVTNEARLYQHLRRSGSTFVSVGHRPSLVSYHDQVLELTGSGGWQLLTAADYQNAESHA